MTEINFVSQFFAGQNNLICIDNDYVITGVHVRGKGRFVFTAQDFCNLCSQAAQSFISCVNNVPLCSMLDGLAIKDFIACVPPRYFPNIQFVAIFSPYFGASEIKRKIT